MIKGSPKRTIGLKNSIAFVLYCFFLCSSKNRKIKDYDNVDRLFFFGEVVESNWKLGIGVNQLVSHATNLVGFLEKEIMGDYEMMVEAVGHYKNDGHSLNMIIADLSATSQELSATVNEISTSMREIATTVEESTKATINIAEKNMNVVEAIHDINRIMEGNKQVSEKLGEIVSQVEY